MIIIETPIFTRRIQAILSDEEYRLLQIHLVNKPDVGKVISGSGACESFDGLREDMEKGAVLGSYIIGSCRKTPFFSFLPIPKVSRMI